MISVKNTNTHFLPIVLTEAMIILIRAKVRFYQPKKGQQLLLTAVGVD